MPKNGSVDDVRRAAQSGVDPTYIKLFEDLGMDAKRVRQMLEERFMMDPDAVKLPLDVYGKQTQRLNKHGGVVPIKKAKKGMRLNKR